MEQQITALANPHLQTLEGDAQQNAARVRELFDSLTPEQLTWKPDPKTWSVAECVEHLTLTDSCYIPGLTKAIEKAGRRDKSNGPLYRQQLIGRLFAWMAGEKKGVKVKAVGLFDPAQTGHGGDINSGERFLAGQGQMLELIRRADSVNINGTKLRSPVSGLIRFSIGDAFTVLISHQKRHIAQAERLIGREGFPQAR